MRTRMVALKESTYCQHPKDVPRAEIRRTEYFRLHRERSFRTET
jgi:hypothetical protein